MEQPQQGDIQGGYQIGEDGIFYRLNEPDYIEDCQKNARTSPAKGGQLFDAVCENNFEKVREILCWDDKSAEKVEFRKWYVNEKSWNDWRALHAAAEGGHIEMAQFLLDCGSEINALSEVKYTALHLGQHNTITHRGISNTSWERESFYLKNDYSNKFLKCNEYCLSIIF